MPKTTRLIDEALEPAIDIMFLDARSQNGWVDRPIDDAALRAAYDIAKWGPTSQNTQPMRLLLLRSREAKERLRPALFPGNVEKAITAPVVAILAYDLRFYKRLAETFPHRPEAASFYANNEPIAQATAFRNATLQAAYFMMALRAVGLDVGPMSGFDAGAVDRAFFAESALRTNLICAIGHGEPAKLMPRLPRLRFEDVARFL